MVKARHGGAVSAGGWILIRDGAWEKLIIVSSHQDYVYALLTGYVDPPPGVVIAEGMNYNPCVSQVGALSLVDLQH